MDIELLGQFGQRLLAPHGGQGHLRFEGRRMVPAGSSAHCLSCSAAILAAVRQKLHLSNLFKNPEPALTSGTFCATTGCRAACSPPTATSSITAAPRGTASSTSLGSSCPSASATGPMHPMHDDQRGLVLPEQLRRSLTWDQGAEMAQHAQLRIDAGLQVY